MGHESCSEAVYNRYREQGIASPDKYEIFQFDKDKAKVQFELGLNNF